MATETMRKYNVDNTEKPPSILSVCTGYGGLERGLEIVFGRINPVAYVEIESFAVANMVDKMESGKMVPAPVWTDLKTFNARPFRGLVDIFTAGYPCQPFSVAGRMRGQDDPRHLWPAVREAIAGCEPGWVFLENVRQHINLGIEEVLCDLEQMGYEVEVGIFSAAEVGAPHRRDRVFVVAHSGKPGAGNNDRQAPMQGRVGTETGPEALRQGNGAACTMGVDPENTDGSVGHSINQRLEGHTGNESGSNEPGRNGTESDRPVAETGLCNVAHPDSKQPTGTGRRTGESLPGRKGWVGCIEHGSSPWSNSEWIIGYDGKARPVPSAESGIRLLVDGYPDRADWLRLLGNGVVPQQAARAFEVLSGKLMKRLYDIGEEVRWPMTTDIEGEML